MKTEHYCLRTAKGAFNTCEICNNADELCLDQKSFTEGQRNIFKAYKKAHLEIQSRERKVLEEQRIICEKIDSRTGAVLKGLVHMDGMTVKTLNTPRIGKGRCNREKEKHMTTRVIGCELICGPIKEYVLITTGWEPSKE